MVLLLGKFTGEHGEKFWLTSSDSAHGHKITLTERYGDTTERITLTLHDANEKIDFSLLDAALGKHIAITTDANGAVGSVAISDVAAGSHDNTGGYDCIDFGHLSSGTSHDGHHHGHTDPLHDGHLLG